MPKKLSQDERLKYAAFPNLYLDLMIGEPQSPCRCYVYELDKLTQFGLRRGAHALECPVYRPSLDPVDAANDQETRTHYIGG